MEDKKTVNDNKKKFLSRVIFLLPVIVVILLIAFPVIKVLTSTGSVIIKDSNMDYYRAEKLFICGNTIICSMDSESAKEKSALPEADRSRFSFRMLSMQNIISIEIDQQQEDAEEEQKLPVDPRYLGKFKIKLQGHEGILYLGATKERLYGTVRFPQWGKGAVETLKVIRIGGGKIRFTRSGSTPEEIKRLGANYFFKQKFSGTYNASGKVIKGIMINDRRERHEWEALKK